ncbi:MAG TPA: mandelate racemase/muconate lactonizing enzyme family protein [Dehalococcoidia bacterium]|nr:mandelate racemase/muconate lactonizing enzyme family protein [Dehalococcoidia bacterium]
MKIVNVQTYIVENPPPSRGGANWLFVKLTTDDGIEGIAEPVRGGINNMDTAKLIETNADRLIIDSDPFQIETLYRKMYGVGGPQSPMSILSAFEIACWDIIGKALDQPIYYLLGGKYHEKIRSYSYMYPVPDAPTSQFFFDLHADPIRAAETAVEYMKMGFTAVKFDPCPPVMVPAPYQLSLETLENAEAVVKNVREAVGDKCEIILGTHAQMTTSSAIRLARRLEKYDPLWFEEPTRPENKDEMARVARHTSIPVATGESLSTKDEFRDLLQTQSASILQFTVGHVGGLLEGKKIAGMAEAYYAQIAPHHYASPVALMANVHLDVCSPNFLITEGVGKLDGFQAEILKEPIRWEEGYIIPPTKPGLGIELNMAVVNQHLYQG